MNKEKRSRWFRISLGLLASVVIVTGVLGGRAYMNYQQEKQEQKLYKRAFRILEELIANYKIDESDSYAHQALSVQILAVNF